VRVETEVSRPRNRDLRRIDAAHLTGTNTNHPIIVRQDNGIRFDMLTHSPGKT
jgi:hypothetical protein